LWLAWAAGGKVSVAQSLDLGRTFTPPVAVNQESLELDWGPDARPKIAIGRDGRAFVAFAIFKDKAFNGQVFYSRSLDAGRSFAPLQPVTANTESQSFEAIALGADGALFAAWLDKRDRVPAKARNETYVGAALTFTWSKDHGATVSDTRIAQDHTCECCRLGIAFAGPGRPAIVFRNVFGGTVRDHAVMTFADPWTPGPVYRVSVDDWKTDACPHHGPSLAISADGTYHVTWFSNGFARKGTFYVRSADGGRTFSEPMPIGRADRNPSHPYLMAAQDALWLVWKEFDGERTTVPAMISHDNGRTWSTPKVVAEASDASDHPLLVTDGRRVFLSWQAQREGYRLAPLEDVP
jgi:BNR/Asp-box repeat